jgi:hypothetical protein
VPRDVSGEVARVGVLDFLLSKNEAVTKKEEAGDKLGKLAVVAGKWGRGGDLERVW